MRIALIITGLGVGGAERVVTGLADCFVARGNEVLVISLTNTTDIMPMDTRVRVETVGLCKRHPLSIFKAMINLYRLLADFKPAIINSHLFHANLLTRLVGLAFRRSRVVSSVHNISEGGAVRTWAYRLTDRLAYVSTNVSDEAVSAFVRKGACAQGRMVTMYNGVAMDYFRFLPDARESHRSQLGVAPDATLLLAVGSLSKQKDYPNLLNAFQRVSDKEASIRLAIVGDGVLREDLEELAKTLGIAEKTVFLGIRFDVAELMSACDIFVLSSAWEGFGLVVAEAMSCERVVIATDCGGVREVVGDAGFLVDRSDSNALYEGLVSALTLPEQNKRLIGKKSRERIARLYSRDAAADKWVSLYQSNK